MKVRHVLWSTVISLLAIISTFYWLHRPTGPVYETPIDPPPEVDYLPVRFGTSGEIEILILPLRLEPGFEEFQVKVWNRHLGLEHAPRTFVAVWLVNHGDQPWSLPEEGLAAISPSLLSDPQELLARVEHPEPWFAHEVRAQSLRGAVDLPPRSRRRVIAALAPGQSLEDLPQLVFPAPDPIVLKPMRIRTRGLMDYELRPRGRIATLAEAPTSPVPTEARELEHAER
ncbi:MAG: hypothetical protein KDB53_10825 [Planctomycetes bacterium]|nr:hypothetical protein [Planctomycetota bacterium]